MAYLALNTVVVDAHLIVHVQPVQHQKGSSDCGVNDITFAITFAIPAALGDDVRHHEFD